MTFLDALGIVLRGSSRRRFGLVAFGFTASAAAAIILVSGPGVTGSAATTDEAWVDGVTVVAEMSDAQAVQAVTDVTDWDDRADSKIDGQLGPWRSIYVVDCHGDHRKLYGDPSSVPCT